MILLMMMILHPHPRLLLPVLPLMMMPLKVMRLHQMNPALIQSHHRPKANLPHHPMTQTPLILLSLTMIPLKTIRLCRQNGVLHPTNHPRMQNLFKDVSGVREESVETSQTLENQQAWWQTVQEITKGKEELQKV